MSRLLVRVAVRVLGRRGVVEALVDAGILERPAERLNSPTLRIAHARCYRYVAKKAGS